MRVVLLVIFAFPCLFLPAAVKAQTSYVDSLYAFVDTCSQEEEKFRAYSLLFQQVVNEDLDQALQIAESELKLAQHTKRTRFISQAYNHIGLVYDFSGDFDKANEYYGRGLEEALVGKDSILISRSELNLGIVDYLQGFYDDALDHYYTALNIAEAHKDTSGISKSLNNIGLVLKDLSQFEKSIAYFKRSLLIDSIIGDSDAYASSCNNLGINYKMLKDYDQALLYYNQALEIRQAAKDLAGESKLIGNLSRIQHALGNYEEALRLAERGLQLEIQLDDKIGQSGSYINIGELYCDMEDYLQSEVHYFKGMKMAEELGLREYIGTAYHGIYRVKKKQGKFQEALQFLEESKIISDSLLNQQTTAKILELEGKYEFDKKNEQIEGLQLESEMNSLLANQEAERNRIMQYVLWGGAAVLLVVGVMGVALFFQSRNRKKVNLELRWQKEIIAEKNEDIISSINYAKRIQRAVLKEENGIGQHLKEHFILFRPKDVVSGDFFWHKKVGDSLFLAVADCTGHGVPGAFMSLLGVTALNELVAYNPESTPGEILDLLRKRIIEELRQVGETGETKDGMDISMVKLNLKTNSMTWSGANNPLWIYRDNELLEWKGDKQPIAHHPIQTPFVTHEIQMQTNDMFYLFSDGYQDQFGGEKGKKFKSSNLKKLFHTLHQKPVGAQRDTLIKTFEEWKGDLEQLDDVCVMGIRIS